MKRGIKVRYKLFLVMSIIVSVILLQPIIKGEVSHAEGGDVIEMLGTVPPDGTIVSADKSYSGMAPSNVIDLNFETFWNSGGYNGSLEMKFPEEIYLDFVQLAASASPKTNVSYKLYGFQSGSWVEISGKINREVENHANKFYTILDPFAVTPGKYSGIRIECAESSTWIAISEITIGSLTPPTAEPSPTPTTTPQPTIEPTSTPMVTASPAPEQPTSDRAILVVTMNTGLEKEFDLSMSEVNDFIAWYEIKQAGTGTASFAIDKHENNKGPFTSRKDYVIFEKILTFSVDEYSVQ
ncbi:hypothetical protein [Paenibacillus sp. FSL R7-0331]|uniref:hypothetical protein n=1 Tax=Paenibacillus sp. FSL R7-0331 TaxID=1536773 RepID=UPI001E504FBE|nr:hypothetical protein [Paenibacillus sp. FSL R7-0331]